MAENKEKILDLIADHLSTRNEDYAFSFLMGFKSGLRYCRGLGDLGNDEVVLKTLLAKLEAARIQFYEDYPWIWFLGFLESIPRRIKTRLFRHTAQAETIRLWSDK
jgi:hypothetical protein